MKCYIFVKKVNDSLNQIVKRAGGGEGWRGSTHGLLTFVMVHCLGISIGKDME